ncbi:MAG: hypothetical protein Q8Q87_00400 [Candidatus Omnitrophota bacterium]|nr:hypothetical protein [Candidatus Omnitrophota bacterium]
MKKLILAVALMMLIPSQSLAKESPESMFMSLPVQIKTFVAGAPVSYPDKRLGASIGYNSPTLTAITVYLYDQGIENVEDGIDSDVIRQSKEMAMNDIREVERMGIYRNVEIIADDKAEFDIGGTDPLKMLFASYSCDMVDQDSGGSYHVISDLYVAGMKGYICKVRITRSPDANEAEIKEVLTAIFSKISK